MFGNSKKKAAASRVLASFAPKLPHVDALVPPGMTARQTGKGVLLAGASPDALSSGVPGGYSIQVPNAIEAAASGKRVRVTVTACSRGKTPTAFAVAYSTNEVGNSGWNEFTASDKRTDFAFEYDVSPMVYGNGDFVSVRAVAALELRALKVEVIERLKV